MNVALRRRAMAIEEFLDWEKRQELRFEFDGVQPVANDRGTDEHSSLTLSELYQGLDFTAVIDEP